MMQYFSWFGWFSMLFMISTANPLHSTTTSEVFKRHWNPVFIESGSCLGDGIENALQAGFTEIHSIELLPSYYQLCCNRFQNNPYVHLYPGDSSVVLNEILEHIDQRATFWLDGHYSWNGTARGDTNTPILAELACIANHHIKNHTILIDDVREFGTVEFDFIELEDIIKVIKEINPDYEISYEDGYICNDVLVAEIR